MAGAGAVVRPCWPRPAPRSRLAARRRGTGPIRGLSPVDRAELGHVHSSRELRPWQAGQPTNGWLNAESSLIARVTILVE